MSSILERLRREDGGFTLVELIVAMVVSLSLGTVIISTLLGAQNAHKTATTQQDLTEEARSALNRLAFDLRQAKPTTLTTGGSTTTTPAIVSVQNAYPGGTANAVTSITFDADFDGDGCVAGVASDTPVGATATCSGASAPQFSTSSPEIETFCWAPSSKILYLVAGTVTGQCTPTTTGAGQPLLSGKVTSFELDYASSQYLCDSNSDGITSWQELDDCGGQYGNTDGVLDMPELSYIDSVIAKITVSDGTHQQNYETQIELRNVG